MISVNFGMTKIKGSTPMILTDLMCIASAIAQSGLKGIESKESLKKEVLKAVEDGFENTHADNGEAPDEIKSFLASLFKDLAEDLEKGKGEE